MRTRILDTKELLGYRLLSEEELSNAAATSAKVGGKAGMKGGHKPAV